MQKEIVVAAMKFAEESPWPDPMTLEEGVFAPEDKLAWECKSLKFEKLFGRPSMRR